MIDIHHERLLPVRDLPAYLEARGLGRRVSPQTVWRWIVHGSRGVRLETTTIGGSAVTSLEALQRWADARATAKVPSRRQESGEPPQPAPPDRTPTPEHRASVHLLTEHRVMATEIDRLIDTLAFPESARVFAAGLLFRAGLRTRDDARRLGRDGLLAIPGLGAKSKAVVASLWQALDGSKR